MKTLGMFVAFAVLLTANNARGAEEEAITLQTVPPVVVKSVPVAGSQGVDPGLKEIRVTFSKRMLDKSWSFTTGGMDIFPETVGDIHYLRDGKTCVLPVKLKPNQTYGMWINSGRHQNFKDADGRSAVPYLLVFETGDGKPNKK